MAEIDPTAQCPYTDNAMHPQDETHREHLLNWYLHSGFRGCLFNKIAAREAIRGEYPWITIVEEATIIDITEHEAGQRVLDQFDDILQDSDKPALVSYIFPSLRDPQAYLGLLMYLHTENPDRFRLLPPQDREKNLDNDPEELVGVQFRIKLGETKDHEAATAFPMIYTPDSFTTFARRYDYFMITFNRYNSKENPETPDTFIGVDDINLGLPSARFDTLYQRSLAVRDQAHAATEGEAGSTSNRHLFRAHNALVIPASTWDKLGQDL